MVRRNGRTATPATDQSATAIAHRPARTQSAAFAKSHSSTLAHHGDGNLGTLIATDDLRLELVELINRRSFLGAGKAQRQTTIEQHLVFCACHLANLKRLVEGDRRPTNYELNRAQQLSSMPALYERDNSFYIPWGLVLFVVLGNPGHIVAILYMSMTYRYIYSRGVLSAYCDMFGSDPPNFEA